MKCAFQPISPRVAAALLKTVCYWQQPLLSSHKALSSRLKKSLFFQTGLSHPSWWFSQAGLAWKCLHILTQTQGLGMKQGSSLPRQSLCAALWLLSWVQQQDQGFISLNVNNKKRGNAMLLFSVLGFPHSWGSDCVMLLFSMVDLSLKPVVYLKRATSREICLFSSIALSF